MMSLVSRATRGALALGLTTALLSGCAQEPAEPIDLKSATTLGVGSTCGEALHRESYGYIFGRDDKTSLKVPEWGLDASIVAELHAHAPTTLQVVDVKFDPVLVALAQMLRKRDDPNALWQNAFAKAEPKADLYVVIFPRNAAVFWRGDQGYISTEGKYNEKYGFGIYSRGFAGTAHAGCGAFVFDTRTQKVVRRFSPTELADMPRGLSKDTWSDYSEDELRQVRAILSPMATRIGEKIATWLVQDSNLVPAAVK